MNAIWAIHEENKIYFFNFTIYKEEEMEYQPQKSRYFFFNVASADDVFVAT